MLIDELSKLKPTYFVLSGGEPLLRRDFFELASYAVKKGLHISLATNGLLLDEEVATKLKDVGVKSVYVSVDGASPITNDRIRGRGSFRKAINAVEICVKSGLRTGIAMTITKINVKDVPRMINLAMNLGVSTLSFRRFKPAGRGFVNRFELELSIKQHKEFLTLLKCKKEELQGVLKIRYHDPLWALIDSKNYSPCVAGRSLFSIMPNGDVWACPHLPISAGNIREKPLEQIWENSSFLKQLRNRELLRGKCSICQHKYVCGGCRSAAYAYYGDCFGTDPKCWI